MLWVVAGATRQYFMYPKFAPAFERIFGVPFRATTTFLFAFFEHSKNAYTSLAFFFRERKRERK